MCKISETLGCLQLPHASLALKRECLQLTPQACKRHLPPKCLSASNTKIEVPAECTSHLDTLSCLQPAPSDRSTGCAHTCCWRALVVERFKCPHL
jgi:hypothetical protein